MSSHHYPTRFLNRELGVLEFNRRVLAQAADPATPLLERLRFLCIVSNNLDEFFEIRVAGLKERIRLHPELRDPDGSSAIETFHKVSAFAHQLVDQQYVLLNEVVLPGLADAGVRFIRRSDWTETQREWIRDYFHRDVLPLLTPIRLDPAHPFPLVLNKSLNFAVELEGRDAFGRDSGSAIVQAPRFLPRIVRLPREISPVADGFVLLSSILHEHVQALFHGMKIRGCYQFRVTRNSDLFVDEEEVTNLRTALQGELSHRNYGNAVRLEVAEVCPDKMAQFLLTQFGLNESDLYRVNGPVNLVRLNQVPDLVDRPDLKFVSFVPGLPPQLPADADIFAVLRKGDVLLHHPFQSFQPVVRFIEQAAQDPQVVAIKQTVYRAGTDSALMEALIEAARQGKEVTVVVELMARFDEEANINWSARLEEAGAHVVYGVVGYKTHAKMAMVIRREKKGLKRYAHLGTGNYHARTARLYTDFGLLTARDDLCADVADIFLQLTGLGQAARLRHAWQAPFTLHTHVLKEIRVLTQAARQGRRARLIAKMNALLEPDIIEALYQASQAGVKIDLIVRGVCVLRPGVAGLSDHIRVISVVGRFLEHSRIFCFRIDRTEKLYLSSADWMARNFFRRIEVCFPVLDAQLRARIIEEGLKPYLADNLQAWRMLPDGSYQRRTGRHKRSSAQEELMARLGACLVVR